MNPALILLAVAALGLASWYYQDEIAEGAATLAQEARDFIAKLEGFSATGYDDHKGQSVGFGTLITDPRIYGEGLEMTRDQALRSLEQSVSDAEATVARLVKVPLTANQRTALASLVYNIGAGQFGGSTLLRKLNAGDYQGAADEFGRWVKASGQTVPGLVSRRAQERALFLA